jgi:hypothetical protein
MHNDAMTLPEITDLTVQPYGMDTYGQMVKVGSQMLIKPQQNNYTTQ